MPAVELCHSPNTCRKGRDMADNVADVVEAELAELSQRLTEPGERECLRCYLLRMISEFGCDGSHRWTVRWRDLRAPRARGLVRRMQRRGGARRGVPRGFHCLSLSAP